MQIVSSVSRVILGYRTIYSQSSLRATLILALTAPISAAFTTLVNFWCESIQRTSTLAQSHRSGTFHSVFGSHFATVRSNAAELREYADYCDFLARQHLQEQRARLLSAVFQPLSALACDAGRVAGLVMLGIQVRHGNISTAAMIQLMTVADIARIDVLGLPQQVQP